MSETIRRKNFTPRLPESWRNKVSEEEWANACQQDCIDQKLDMVMEGQIESTEARDKIIALLESHTKDVFPKHEVSDTQHFSAIRSEVEAVAVALKPTVERVASWSKWLDFVFSRNGILVGVITVVLVPLLVNLATATFKSKLDAAAAAEFNRTNATAILKKP